MLMRPFGELVSEAERADVAGWGFGFLQGRATEQRPPWGYSGLLSQRLSEVASALDIDTGGGELLAEMPNLPPRMTVTEDWPVNKARAKELLEPRGVQVLSTVSGRIPLPGQSFELISSRHPVRPEWSEIHRLLALGGLYCAQHVGPGSAWELIEFLLGPLPQQRSARDPELEAWNAEKAGLHVVTLERARCRMEFFDVGAVVWILRKCPWWIPGFTADQHEESLRVLDAQMRSGTPFVAHSTRHLIEARRQPVESP